MRDKEKDAAIMDKHKKTMAKIQRVLRKIMNKPGAKKYHRFYSKVLVLEKFMALRYTN